MTRQELAHYIDHTLLRQDALPQEIVQLVDQALRLKTYAVCVNSGYVRQAREARREQAQLKIAATVGFPLGQSSTAAKVAETLAAINDGADEIDMVWNLGRFLSHDYTGVYGDIQAVVEAAGPIPVKVILETARLNDDQITEGAQLAVSAGAHTVKTSTGFGVAGATRDAVEILCRAVGPHVGVKAAGGIRTYKEALTMIEAGATRLGLSSTEAVLDGIDREPTGVQDRKTSR